MCKNSIFPIFLLFIEIDIFYFPFFDLYYYLVPYVYGQSTVSNLSGEGTTWGGDQRYWTGPQPIRGTTGDCYYSCWGMDQWPWCTWPPWWFLWYCVPPYLQWRSCPPWCDDLWHWHGYRWGKGPEMFLEPFPKGHCRFCYLLLKGLQPITPVPVDYSAFLFDVILILEIYQEVSDGVNLPWSRFGAPFYHKHSCSFFLNPLYRVPPCGCWYALITIGVVVAVGVMAVFAFILGLRSAVLVDFINMESVQDPKRMLTP